MNKIESQAAKIIFMVRPASFGFNTQTASSNSFQIQDSALDEKSIADYAISEFDHMVDSLRKKDIEVIVFEDTPFPQKPDAVFPNNWISTHADSTIITYPMYSPNRRPERREDIIHILTEKFAVKQHYSFETAEEDDLFLEGTGSMILDRENKIVYAALSPRTDPQLLDRFALLRRYQKVQFHAKDLSGGAIYHTNVIMALGHNEAVLCTECISDENEKAFVMQSLIHTQKEIIEITWDQVLQFTGNMLQVQNKYGDFFWILSTSAYASLSAEQKKILSRKSTLLPISIPTIEKYGGGSVRCMIAEVML